MKETLNDIWNHLLPIAEDYSSYAKNSKWYIPLCDPNLYTTLEWDIVELKNDIGLIIQFYEQHPDWGMCYQVFDVNGEILSICHRDNQMSNHYGLMECFWQS